MEKRMANKRKKINLQTQILSSYKLHNLYVIDV